MLKNNYHTHMAFCGHADGMVMDYVRKASELGFSELGMSDHAPILKEFMTEDEYISNWGMDSMTVEQIDEYLEQIEEARRKYPKLTIYSGFETEYLSDKREYYASLRKRVDYMNLGLHFFRLGDKVINAYCELDYTNLEEYVKAMEEALSTGFYSAVVHPDMYMYGYRDEKNEWTFDEHCERAARAIAELAMKYDVPLEVNTNGLKYCRDKYDESTWLYPYPKFWEIVKEYPVKIILGADAHTPDALGNENVRLVCEFAERMGLVIEEKMVLK